MIKIPGTTEGLPAVEQVISEGINVNVTLLFSLDSYVETAWTYIRGLEKRAEGKDISKISSVASFFLSRIDSNIDKRIDETQQGIDDIALEAKLRAVKGKVAIANAKSLTKSTKKLSNRSLESFVSKGANVQRLLWASTSTKDPSYSDVMYVDELVGPTRIPSHRTRLKPAPITAMLPTALRLAWKKPIS